MVGLIHNIIFKPNKIYYNCIFIILLINILIKILSYDIRNVTLCLKFINFTDHLGQIFCYSFYVVLIYSIILIDL